MSISILPARPVILSLFLIYRRLDILKPMVYARQAFRVSDQQISPADQTVVKPVNKALLSLFIKVDHNIPTEDEMHGAFERKGLHQI